LLRQAISDDGISIRCAIAAAFAAAFAGAIAAAFAGAIHFASVCHARPSCLF
jgi:hypothetical protein